MHELRALSLNSLKADPYQDMKGGFAKCLNGAFP